jgi:pyruvate-formate lyase-activating enzyme
MSHEGKCSGCDATQPNRAGADAALAPQSSAALDASITAGPRLILWDLVGSCNLRCPSCPVGSMQGTNTKGLIDDSLFDAILAKLAREFPRWQLHFYNWTEPLIHPSINRFCRSAAEAGFHLHLSSNLNHLKDPEGLMAAGMKTFRISLSGFTQPVYGIGHRGGAIEKVKTNMRRLSDAKRTTGSRTRIHVYFHKYRHNLHELEAMRAYATELGFEFCADWAFLMPVEKLVQYMDGTLSDSEREFADRSLVPRVGDAIEAMLPERESSCELIDQLVLDFQGNVSLCCAVYDAKRNFIGRYLDRSWPELQATKYAHSTCTTCMRNAAHVLYTHFSKPELVNRMRELVERQLAEPPQVGQRGPIPLPVLDPAAFAASA